MLEAFDAPLHIAQVTLDAADPAALARWYEEVLGLDRLGVNGDSIALGSGGVAYLALRQAADPRPASPRAPGLFHTAFLLPSRADLGAWFTGARARGARFDGASDHGVSEAFYLSDPEGNGIEVYADRPRAQWPRARDGERVYDMVTEPMDIATVVAAGARTESGNSRFPPEARIGHVHLRVADLDLADAFYRARLGLSLMDRRPGAVFLAAGLYHHHIALNTWASRGEPPRPQGRPGLSEITVAITAPAPGYPADEEEAAIDPGGTVLRVRRASAPR